MKLSQSMKDRMKNLILSDKFTEEEKTIDLQLRRLGDDIYKSIPDISKAQKLPKGWLPVKTYISCSFNGMRDYVYLTEAKPMPDMLYDKRQDFTSDHEFTKRFRVIYEAKENTALRRNELKHELEGVLAGVNTDKQLLSIWPEAIKWLPSTSVPVPVVQSVDRLKQLLGSDL